MTSPLAIRRADGEADFAALGVLIREYVAWLDIDLRFQNLDAELSNLPRQYGPPEGIALLAWDGPAAVGGVALRPCPAAGPDACEMKRLYVRADRQGSGLGRRLAAAVMEAGRDLGYRRMVLDTLAGRMDGAIALYRNLGFHERRPYYHNPVPGMVFLEAGLDPMIPTAGDLL